MRQQLRQDIALRTFVIDDTTYHAVQLEDFPKYWATTCGHIISTHSAEPMVRANEYDRDGYVKLTLNNEGRKTTRFVHRLVALTFLESPDDDRDGNPRNQINHINGVKDDNKLCNLEFASGQENMNHCHQVLAHIKDHVQGTIHGSR
jgi:hypothetical protein